MDGATRFRINKPSIVNEIIDGEVVMINLDTGSYYSADRTGAAIWEAISRGASLQEIVQYVAQRFEGVLRDIEREVAGFVERLTGERLIVADAALPAGDLPAPDADTKHPFQTPRLERYDDMQELLLADPIHDVDETGWPPRPAPPRRK